MHAVRVVPQFERRVPRDYCLKNTINMCACVVQALRVCCLCAVCVDVVSDKLSKIPNRAMHASPHKFGARLACHRCARAVVVASSLRMM